MVLTIYDIIKGPIVTSKAYKLNNKEKQLVIEVHIQANKPLIKEALEKLFNVKVKAVRTMIRKGRRRMVRRIAVYGNTSKRAIVTLMDGYEIGAFNQAAGGSPVDQIELQKQKSVQE